MSFLKYLKEKITLIIFYLLLITFISLAVFFDRKNRVLSTNLTYIIFVSFIMFIIYILTDYYMENQHIKELMQLQSSQDKTPILPKPVNYQDEIYASIIENLYKNYIDNIKIIDTEFKENNDFITSWVHEIKTPITTSKLLIQNDEPSLESLKSINEEIDKIDDYVEKVLYYSRCDNFSKDYLISEVSLNKLIKESIKKHSIIFIKKHITLVNEVSQSFTVDTDKKWLLFIIDQLLSNALKYTENQGKISFTCHEDNKEKFLIIQDNGVGIKKQDLMRIFERSFTGYNGRNENLKSTGLGLYLSERLAKKLGHHITIESEYKIGTKAIIHFPKWNDYFDVTKM